MQKQASKGYQLCCTLAADSSRIDDNGHLNIAEYGFFFEEAACVFLPMLGFGAEYKQRRNSALFAGQTHTWFFKEVLTGAQLDIHGRLLELGNKAILTRFLMVEASTWRPIAINDLLWIHVDLTTRKACAIGAEDRARLQIDLASATISDDLPNPPNGVGFRGCGG